MATFWRSYGLLLLLAIGFVVVRVGWSATYPPTRNYDHFNTETALNVLENPALYPSDPIWQGGGQTDSLGWLFMGFLWGVERVFGDYRLADVWVGLYAFQLVIYLTGAFVLFRFLMDLTPPPTSPSRPSGTALPATPSGGGGVNSPSLAKGKGLGDGVDLAKGRGLESGVWLPALLAIISSLPFYLYFSYTNWGINTPYARHFVTMQAGWIFLAVMWVLQHPKPRLWWWAVIGLWIGSTTYWNPVNGLALTLIIPFTLLIEVLGGRLNWRAWVLVMGLAGGIFAFYYLTSGSNFTEATESAPLTEADLQQIVDSWVDFAGLHFFPWTVSAKFALHTLTALSVGSLLLLITAPFTSQLSRWWVIGLVILMLQVPAPSIFTKSTLFLLPVGYWLSRYQRIDRWDVFWLSLFCAVNLAGLAQSALGYYFFTEHKLLAFASVAFEGYRPIRWAFLVLFVLAGRWCADLARQSQKEGGNFLALGGIALILGTIIGHAGHVGIDDSVIILPRDTTSDLRYGLPFLAIIIALLAQFPTGEQLTQFKRVLSICAIPVSLYAGHSIFTHLADWYRTIPATYAIGAIVAVGVGLAIREKWWVRLIFVGVMFGLVIAPLSAYYRAKPNGNLPPDFEQATAWTREHTPNDALFLTYALDPMPFRAQGERSVLAWDVLQTFYFLGPRSYLESFGFLQELISLDPAQPEVFRTTLEKWGVDYILAPTYVGTLPYPAVFESPQFIIYQVGG